MSPADRQVVGPPLHHRKHQEEAVGEGASPNEILEVSSCHSQSTRKKGEKLLQRNPKDDEFQDEKKPFKNHDLDQEEEVVVAEKKQGENKNEDEKDVENFDNQSCSSTTPTANSWSILGEEEGVGLQKTCPKIRESMVKNRHGTEEENKEQDVDDDRKPPAVDKTIPFDNFLQRGANSLDQDQHINMPSQPIPAAASFASGDSENIASHVALQGPPPLISHDQQQLLAMALSSQNSFQNQPPVQFIKKKAPSSPASGRDSFGKIDTPELVHHATTSPFDSPSNFKRMDRTSHANKNSKQTTPTSPLNLKNQQHTFLAQKHPRQQQQAFPLHHHQQQQQQQQSEQHRQLHQHQPQSQPQEQQQQNQHYPPSQPPKQQQQHQDHPQSQPQQQQQQQQEESPVVTTDMARKLQSGPPNMQSQNTQSTRRKPLTREEREKERVLHYKKKLEKQRQFLLQQHREGGIPDPDLIPSSPVPRGSLRVHRRRSTMEANLNAIAVSDPSFHKFVSEPAASVASRHTVDTPSEKRKSLEQKRASRMLKYNARHHIMGVSSSEVEVKQQQQQQQQQQTHSMPRDGQIPFPPSPRFNVSNVTLDNPSSVHSSIGYNPESSRSILDSSTDGDGNHLSLSPRKNSARDYRPQLTPPREGGSVSSVNLVEAGSAIHPPNPDEFRRKQSARRRSVVEKQSMSSLQHLMSHSNITREDASSIGGASLGSRRQGLRLAPHEKCPETQTSIQHQPNDVSSPAQKRRMDPSRFVSRAHKEVNKAESKLWGSILEDQNEIIMELACALSERQNQRAARQHSQQPEFQRPPDPAPNTTPLSSFSTSTTSFGYNLGPSPPLSWQEQQILQQQASALQNLCSDPALDMALGLSKEEGNTGTHHFDSTKALELAMEISRSEANSVQESNFGTDASLDLALAISKRETLAPQAPLEPDDQTMEVALELSKGEYEYEVSRRNAPHATVAAPRQPPTGHVNGESTSRQPRSTNVGNNNAGLVMPSEMIEDDKATPSALDMARNQRINEGATNNTEKMVQDEALAMAITLSRMDTRGLAATTSGLNSNYTTQTTGFASLLDENARSVELAKQLSHEESVGYLMDSSKAATGTGTGSHQESQPQTAIRSHFQSRQNWYDESKSFVNNTNTNVPLEAAPRFHTAGAGVAGGSNNDEAALRLAVELSYQDAYGTSMPQNNTMPDDDSLEVALALSRREAYGDGTYREQRS